MTKLVDVDRNTIYEIVYEDFRVEHKGWVWMAEFFHELVSGEVSKDFDMHELHDREKMQKYFETWHGGYFDTPHEPDFDI